jgi:hypothetical protein
VVPPIVVWHGDPERDTFVEQVTVRLLTIWTRAPVRSHPAARRVLVLVPLLASIGCGEKKVVTEPEEIGILRAEIDGINFLGENELYAQHVNGILAIAARDGDGRTIHITVLNNLKPETVSIGPGSQSSAVTALKDAFWRSNISGGTGTVTISKVGAFGAEGTFSFTAMAVPNTKATGMRTVTGRFNVEYVVAAGSIFGPHMQFALMERSLPHATRTGLN